MQAIHRDVCSGAFALVLIEEVFQGILQSVCFSPVSLLRLLVGVMHAVHMLFRRVGRSFHEPSARSTSARRCIGQHQLRRSLRLPLRPYALYCFSMPRSCCVKPGSVSLLHTSILCASLCHLQWLLLHRASAIWPVKVSSCEQPSMILQVRSAVGNCSESVECVVDLEGHMLSKRGVVPTQSSHHEAPVLPPRASSNKHVRAHDAGVGF